MNLVRDAIELGFVVAIGGMVNSALKGIRRRSIHPYMCGTCRRPTSRAYAKCTHCGATVSG